MKELYLECISGMSGLERFGMNTLIIVTVLAVVISTIAMICLNWRFICATITFKALRLCFYLEDVNARITLYNEKNDAELKACKEQWWDEVKALRTEMPTFNQVIAYQLRRAIR